MRNDYFLNFEDFINLLFGNNAECAKSECECEHKHEHEHECGCHLPVERRRFEPAHPMRSDVTEKDGVVTIEAELPGFNKDEISVTVSNGRLVISAKRDEKAETKEEKKTYLSERHSSVTRVFRVPQNLTPADFAVKYDNGVLTVSYSRKEKVDENTKIEIQ